MVRYLLNMASSTNNNGLSKWLQVVSSLALIVTFFLTWVIWDGNKISGYSMPSGEFFKTSETKFGLANPFPQFSFSFYIFLLIPLLALLTAIAALTNKKTAFSSFIAGTLSLALLTVFVLFTNTLIDLGVGNNVFNMLQPVAWIHAAAAVILIITAFPVKSVTPKVIWLLIGPIIAYGSYKLGEKYIMGETHKATEDVKADYTVTAVDLLKEFATNDSATNRKYLDKTMVINGNASAVNILADSTSTIKFEDSTGSYVIFSLEKDQLNRIQQIKTGTPVSVKGVCSGSIFSEILGTTSVSFKRATLNKK